MLLVMALNVLQLAHGVKALAQLVVVDRGLSQACDRA